MNLKDLINKLNEDKDFETKFKSINSYEDMMDFASREGYEVSEKEIETLRSELEYLKSKRVELSDDELENVAGGFVAPVAVMGGQMGPYMGPTPDWLSRLVTIFINKDNKGPSSGTGKINASPLPATNVTNKTTILPNTLGGATITTLPSGGVITPTDKTEFQL